MKQELDSSSFVKQEATLKLDSGKKESYLLTCHRSIFSQYETFLMALYSRESDEFSVAVGYAILAVKYTKSGKTVRKVTAPWT